MPNYEQRLEQRTVFDLCVWYAHHQNIDYIKDYNQNPPTDKQGKAIPPNLPWGY